MAKLATDKQIKCLQYLADRVERKRKEHPDIFKMDIPYIDWENERHKGVTVQDASIRIDAYHEIISWMNFGCELCGYPQT